MKPLISIITVCYNAEANIGPTLHSVDSQDTTGLDAPVFEHLVIDGASTDSTLDILAAHSAPYRTVISERDGGLYHAMNKGLDIARGEYVVFLNAGDRFHGKNVLRRIAEAVAGAVSPGIIYGQTVLVDNDGHELGPRHLRAPEHLTLASFKDGMLVCHQAFIVLNKITEPFNTAYRYSADYEWCIRCLQHSRRNVYLGETPIIDYLSEGITTKNRGASLKERFRIMCYYYGTLSTVARHAGFVLRLLRAKKGQSRN